MKYPNFLKKNDLVGITALSSGTGDKILEVKVALNHLKEYFRLIITPDVYGQEIVSADKETRIEEINELLDEDIKLLLNIRGGDFLYETLDGIDYSKIVKKNVWVMGYSDITSLLYILTTKYDLATIYGFNAKSFDDLILSKYQLNNLEILAGNIITQHSFDSSTISLNGNFKDKGILIGGCLDTLRYLIGTEYDKTTSFIEKYKDYKIVWYFDIFRMDSVDFYLTILKLNNLGWFKYSDTFLFGRVLFPKEECNLSYEEAMKRVFNDKNIVFNADIGHVRPSFTLINGSLANIEYEDNKLVLKMEFLDENNG